MSPCLPALSYRTTWFASLSYSGFVFYFLSEMRINILVEDKHL